MSAGRARPALEALLDPKSVAIIGASDDPGRIGGRPLRYLREAGYPGAVYPVNARRAKVQGLDAYPGIADVPGPVEFALVAVPAPAVVGAIEACAAKGVRAAVVFSSGFAETGEDGRREQERIGTIARGSGMRVLGPNCLGLFNVAARFFPTFTSTLDTGYPEPGRVGVVSQSGAYGSHFYAVARNRGLGFGHWITTGNECDVTVPECLLWLADDPGTDVIVAYAEGVRDRDALIEAFVRARENGKPVVFMKVGRSEVGAAAIASHTASLAGSDAVYDGAFRQFGVHRARTTEELLDVAYACTRGLYPRGDRLGLITISGGVGVQMADAAEEQGLQVPPLPEDAQGRLKELVPFAAVRNPVDITVQIFNDMSLVARSVEVVLERGGFDAVVAFFTAVAGSGYIADRLTAELRAVRERFADRLIVLSIVASGEIVRRYERELGFPVFEDPTRAVAAVAALARFGRSFARFGGARPAVPALPAASVPPDALPLGEHEAKRLLAAAGIPVVTERLAATPEDAARAAEEIGFPVVLKVASPDILHKTEIGGVLLGVGSADAATAGATELLRRARAARPGARVDGVLVAPMVKGGVETILGVSRDPVFGPVVMFGLGGVFVEVLNDVAFRVAPFDRDEARRMVDEVRGKRLLEGVRGAPRADVAALADALARLSAFAAANAETVESIDVNPFVVLPEGQGALALDALIVPRRPGGAP